MAGCGDVRDRAAIRVRWLVRSRDVTAGRAVLGQRVGAGFQTAFSHQVTEMSLAQRLLFVNDKIPVGSSRVQAVISHPGEQNTTIRIGRYNNDPIPETFNEYQATTT